MSDNAIEVLERVSKSVERIDNINIRLVNLMIVMCISFSVTFISISYFYFCNENSVPTIIQSQSDNVSSNANIKVGGKN